MKKMLVFVFIMAIGVATLLAPVNAQEASGQTEVGYTTNTTVEIPGGSIEPTTGDHTALGSKMILLGVSSIVVFSLILIGRKRRKKEKATPQ